MTRRVELFSLISSDILALALAQGLFQLVSSGPNGLAQADVTPVDALVAGPLLVAGWLVLFLFAGLYQERFAGSRLDELFTLVKVIAVGALVLFFVVFIDRMSPGAARVTLATYGAAVLLTVSTGRMVVRAVQRARIVRGHGVHRAVVVGWSDRVEALHEEVARYPAAGIRIVGAVRLRRRAVPIAALAGEGVFEDDPALTVGDAIPRDGVELAPVEPTIAELPALIDRLRVQDVLIALGPDDHVYLDEVLRVCDGRRVALKIVPDFYTAIGGMARTEHMYGLPLIEVLPQPMPPWERNAKRLVDLVVSAVVLAVGAPVWLIVGALVRVSSHGPAIYRQERVGKDGQPFEILKFRTMVQDAERETGPVWAQPGDARTTKLGAWLRRWRIDEVPQLLNVLRGDMSLVGPRPERPFFVDQLAREIPLYSRRHRVQPGVTGLAQVKWRYDNDLEDVRQKLKYDLFYIENMGIGMDIKILLQTIRTALSGKGH
ncbi:MAG TPA: sugar transferase [Rhodothermales bacterium]|nr:sugar transferase [Rhodothermales bacterium]